MSLEMESCSPCSAAWAAETRRLVTPDMAETTATTGRWAAVDLTMAAARAMQLASPTEVPPNFMTWREFGIGLGNFRMGGENGEGRVCRRFAELYVDRSRKGSSAARADAFAGANAKKKRRLAPVGMTGLSHGRGRD